jgi:hypothetical protein
MAGGKWFSQQTILRGSHHFDRLMVGIRTERLELDEAWSFVAKKTSSATKFTPRATSTFSSRWPERKNRAYIIGQDGPDQLDM